MAWQDVTTPKRIVHLDWSSISQQKTKDKTSGKILEENGPSPRFLRLPIDDSEEGNVAAMSLNEGERSVNEF